MTESGANQALNADVERDASAPAVQVFLKKAIGAAASKLVSASIGDMARCAAAVMAGFLMLGPFETCFAQEAGPATDLNSSLSNLKPNFDIDADASSLSDEELEAQAAQLAAGITYRDADGNAFIRRWNKRNLAYSILFSEPGRVGPVPPHEISGIIDAEMGKVSSAAGIQTAERSAIPSETLDISIRIAPPQYVRRQITTVPGTTATEFRAGSGFSDRRISGISA